MADMTGLTFDECYDLDMVAAYRQQYAFRQEQLSTAVPQDPSDEYKHSLTLQYQKLRDLHKVCLINSLYLEHPVPVFITQCRRKEIKYRAKIDMLLLAFPFLQRIDGVHFDNDI